LTIRDRSLTVVIPVAAIPVGYKWDEAGEDLLTWLKANHQAAPKEGESKHVVQVGASSKLGPLYLEIWLQTMHLLDYLGATMISRGPMPKNFGEIVEKALGDKLPKLVALRLTSVSYWSSGPDRAGKAGLAPKGALLPTFGSSPGSNPVVCQPHWS
jgi:hypothetical protein